MFRTVPVKEIKFSHFTPWRRVGGVDV
jgi:hypothetical protein